MRKLSLSLLCLTLCVMLSAMTGADFWPDHLSKTQKPNAGSNPGPKVDFDRALPQSRIKAGPKYDPWPQNPPQIGNLVLKQEYWDYMKEAAQKYSLSPYLIQAVCAIESRYNPRATSGRGQCYGLMQLHWDTARKYAVNPLIPKENIMGGAAVLANLLTKSDGDLSRVLRVYNATCTAAYEREVKKAFYQATMSGEASLRLAKKRTQGSPSGS